MIRLEVPAGQDGQALSACLRDMLPQLRPSEAARLLKKGDVKINGKRTKKDVELAVGDVLEVYAELPYDGFLPEADIAYEDQNLMIINKQPGISCVDDREDGKPTLYDVAEAHMKKRGEFDVSAMNVPYICHRLDHNTGGLVIVAKTQTVYDFMVKAFRERRVRKFYRAIVCGRPERSRGELLGYIIKDSAGARVRVLQRPHRSALPAVTRYETVKTDGTLSLLDLELVTGRTHQARAHLASVGLPILGDDKYGNRRMNKKYGVRYQALWAYKIRFETGRNHFMEYLNGREVVTDHIEFPYVEIGEGPAGE